MTPAELTPICRFRIQLVKAVPDSEALQFMKALSAEMPKLKVSEHRGEKNIYKLSTNPSAEWDKETYVKIIEGQLIEMTWGPSFSREEQDSDTQALYRVFAATVGSFMLEVFDSNWMVDIPMDGNQYDVFRQAFYKDSTVGALYDNLHGRLGDSFKVLDNDLKLNVSLGERQLAQVAVQGNVSRKEIRSAKYDEGNKVRISVGVLHEAPKLDPRPLQQCILEHIALARSIIDADIVPTVLSALGSVRSEQP